MNDDEWKQRRMVRLMKVFKTLSPDRQEFIVREARRLADLEMGEVKVDPDSWAFDRDACEHKRRIDRFMLDELEKLKVEIAQAQPTLVTPEVKMATLTAWAKTLPEVTWREPLLPDPILASATAASGPQTPSAPPTEEPKTQDPWEF